MVSAHQIKPVLLFQPLINESPGTILFLVYLALAVVGAAAGTIYQTLVAGGDRTDASRFTEDAVATLGADLVKIGPGYLLHL